MNSRVRVGLVQMRCGREIAPNIEAAVEGIRDAVTSGAELVVTPENTNILELSTSRLFATVSHEAGNPALERLAGLARELGIWLHVGSLAVKLSDDKVANRAFMIGPDGGVIATYDKIHMFDVDLPGGESYRESKNYRPGRQAVIAELPWGRYGMTTCYDLRFAALYRTLAQAGASIIAVPSAFTRITGRAHWHVLLRARAIETGCYIVAAAQGGDHEVGRATFGHSMVVSPWGEIIAEAGEDPCVILTDIDLSQVAEARQRIPSLRHDRAFSPPSGGDAEREAS
ncbi:MAG: carbon-nitrogen hydrolase family protein [Pseudomonadota bacterium]|nr:carbon-nitrogen hydrolase family protein [Pseudomonadota bacterium]